VLALTTLLGAVLSPELARADPDADAEAQTLFDEGRTLMKEGKFSEACPRLEKSQRLSPHGGTLLNVAACHERQGRIATAWVEFQQALTAARADGKDDRARLAQERIDVLQPRLPWIQIDVADPAARDELTVALDDGTVPPAAWGKEMPIDPGTHRIVATAPGRSSTEQRVHLEEGDHRKVAIERGGPTAAPTAAPTPKSASATPAEKPKGDAAPPRTEWEWRRRRHRVVLEGGVFAGVVTGSGGDPEASGGDSSVALQDLSSQNRTSCAQADCRYDFGGAEALVTGGSGFLGYSITERFHFGFRGLAGFRLGGGFAIAIGPAISGRVWGPIWAGTSFVVGDVLELGRGNVRTDPGHQALDSSTSISATSGITVGNGLELGIALFETESGAVFVQTTPVFLIGKRSVEAVVPFGVAYRFF